MRHIINPSIAVIIFETANPLSRESTERYTYFVEYRDSANDLRESDIQNGFFSADHCISDALENLDALDLEPEVKPAPAPPITRPYHLHLCNAGCGNHRCVNPKCEIAAELGARRVAEIICPVCNVQTGSRGYFQAQRFSIASLMPLESVAIAA